MKPWVFVHVLQQCSELTQKSGYGGKNRTLSTWFYTCQEYSGEHSNIKLIK